MKYDPLIRTYRLLVIHSKLLPFGLFLLYDPTAVVALPTFLFRTAALCKILTIPAPARETCVFVLVLPVQYHTPIVAFPAFFFGTATHTQYFAVPTATR